MLSAMRRSAQLATRRLSTSADRHSDVLVLGGGPVGCELVGRPNGILTVTVQARLAGKLGKTVTVVEPRGVLLAAPTGWVSKAIRHASRELGTADGSKRVPWGEVAATMEATAGRAIAMTATQFKDDGLKPMVLAGQAAFVQPNTVSVTGPNGNLTASADTVFIANGSRGSRIPQLPWDNPLSDKWLYDADSIKDIGRLPEHLVIQGGGIIGVEYGFIMRRLGARVTIILREKHVLDGKGVDIGIKTAVANRLQDAGIDVLYQNADVVEVTPPAAGSTVGSLVLASGTKLSCDALLSAIGRSGNADQLGLESGGLVPATPQGHVPVDPDTMRALIATENDCSAVNVFAAGDVAAACAIAPGGLVSTGVAQAHLAAQSAFPEEWDSWMTGHGSEQVLRAFDPHPPVAIWVEDGVGMVGMSMAQADEALPTDWGHVTVKFNDTIKSCVQPRPDDEHLKMIFQLSTGRILGVHIFGRDAAEMIHHAGTLVNAERENTVWHLIRSVPPAVTYQEVLLTAGRRAVEALGGGNQWYTNKKAGP